MPSADGRWEVSARLGFIFVVSSVWDLSPEAPHGNRNVLYQACVECDAQSPRGFSVDDPVSKTNRDIPLK